jgi:hypothetical protein
MVCSYGIELFHTSIRQTGYQGNKTFYVKISAASTNRSYFQVSEWLKLWLFNDAVSTTSNEMDR